MSLNTIEQLIKHADKYNVDRDEVIEFYAGIISMLAQSSTFKNYDINSGGAK